MIKTKSKKAFATMLLGISTVSFCTPAFAAETTPVEKTAPTVIATENVKAVQPRAATYEITGDYVRLRTGPSLSSSTIGYLMKGDIVAFGHGVDPIYADGHYWYSVQVVSGGLYLSTGYVAGDYLLEIG